MTKREPDPEVDSILASWAIDQEWRGLKERTVEEREMFMRRYFRTSKERPLEVTQDGIKAFIKPSYADGTKWAYQQHFRAYCSWLVESGRRDDNPMTGLRTRKKPPGMPRPVKDPDLDRLLEVTSGPARMMILLAAYAGLRIHEIAKVHGSDVNRDLWTLNVIGKGGQPAVMDLAEEIQVEAANYPVDDWWFSKRERGKEDRPLVAMNRTDAWKVVHEAFNAAGVRATPHMLRHSFGTSLLRQGENIRTVQELMRHATISSTQIYTKVTDVQRADAIKRLSVQRASRESTFSPPA